MLAKAYDATAAVLAEVTDWTAPSPCVSESLVHGWDVARGAGLPYSPAPEVVDAVLAASDGAPSGDDMFAPPVVPASGEPVTVLLAKLGRVA